MVNCATQEEIDFYWAKLSEGGDPAAQQCGWVKDKFGLSWQITPNFLDELYRDDNPAGANARDRSHAPNEEARYRQVARSRRREVTRDIFRRSLR